MSFDPTLGRFMQEDPAGYVDGSNEFQYEVSSPIGNVDPSGLTVTIRVWNGQSSGQPGGKRFGHASLELGDGTYISWWPADQTPFTAFGADHVRGEALKDDTLGEGGCPDNTYTINGVLDEDKIKKWWENYKNNNADWNISRNCSQVVENAINSGLPWEYYGMVLDQDIFVAQPSDIENWGRFLTAAQYHSAWYLFFSGW